MQKKIKITDTTLRDAHQSLMATRMKTEDMLPIAAKMDEMGFHSMEVWGGATFDVCMRFLQEDPWERLDKIRQALKKTKLQMLLRGQNLVGYRPYADDVVEEFVRKAAAHGIDIFRIFDAMNDVRNLRKAMETAKSAGAHIQAAICYTTSPVHTLEKFLKMAETLAGMGADSLCIKDMAGILKPYAAYELVSELKKEIGLPVQVHSHCTTGMAPLMYLKAIEAGADVIDTAISSFAFGASQPATETMIASLADTPCESGLDLAALKEIADYFKEVRKKYKEYNASSDGVDAGVLLHQIPGGMISNFMSQLKEQHALHRLPEVLAEVPRVRKEMGYPPLVTPTSQIVGAQAVLNVLAGRYKVITHEMGSYMKGMYGTPPGTVDEEIRKQALHGGKPITGRPADYIKPELPQAAEEIGSYAGKPEDILSYVLFPQVARDFLQTREAQPIGS